MYYSSVTYRYQTHGYLMLFYLIRECGIKPIFLAVTFSQNIPDFIRIAH
ncbi:hypothetical protein S7335_5485 [Synechococcus sp. PCC 7335]|nr:hypothetical protein S7335_5485 [Synechococcus sp. PCC 7335]